MSGTSGGITQIRKVRKETNVPGNKIDHMSRVDSVRGLQIDSLLDDLDEHSTEVKVVSAPKREPHLRNNVNLMSGDNKAFHSGRFDQIDELLNLMEDSSLEPENFDIDALLSTTTTPSGANNETIKVKEKEEEETKNKEVTVNNNTNIKEERIEELSPRKHIPPAKPLPTIPAAKLPSPPSESEDKFKRKIKKPKPTLPNPPSSRRSATISEVSPEENNSNKLGRHKSLLVASKMTSNFKIPPKSSLSSEVTSFKTRSATVSDESHRPKHNIRELKELKEIKELKESKDIKEPASPRKQKGEQALKGFEKKVLLKAGSLNMIPKISKRTSSRDKEKEKEKEKEKDPKYSTEISDAKWKRGTEAEAILGLLQKEVEKMNSGSGEEKSMIDIKIENIINHTNSVNIDDQKEVKERVKLPTPPDIATFDSVMELINSEKTFVSEVEFLFESFTKPLRNKEILPPKITDKLTLNLECLVAFHKGLLLLLEEDPCMENVVKVFSHSRIQELEQIYTIYIGNYQKSLIIFYDKRESNNNFRKFLKQLASNNENISVANLLVSPVHRVCKYEQSLEIITKQYSFDASYDEYCKNLTQTISELQKVMIKVDHKREIADKWDTINNLERNLRISEPIAIPGRFIINESVFHMRIPSDATSVEQQQYKFILFNDSLMRMKMPKPFKKPRVLNIIPFSQIQVIDVTDEHNSIILSHFMATHQSHSEVKIDARSIFYIINLDPSSEIWEVHAHSEKDKSDWITELRSHLISSEKFTEQWKIDKGEKIITADSGKWPQAYINQCRFYITKNYILITWKMFGCYERDTIPISRIHQLSKEKNNTITITTDSSLTFNFQLQNTDLIYYLLTQLTKNNVKTKSPLSLSSFDMSFENMKFLQSTNYFSFALTDDEWESIWDLSSVIELQENEELSHAFDTLSSPLFKVSTGSVTTSSNTHLICGDIFGVESFISGNKLTYSVRGSVHGARILQLDRSTLIKHYEEHPSVLSKFFACLTLKLLN